MYCIDEYYRIHFEALGLYVYASTESIIKKALNKSILSNFSFSKVDCIEGDILCIDKNGTISREDFEPMICCSHFSTWYDYDDPSYYNIHEEMLLAYCGCYGVDSSDGEMLLEYGYSLLKHSKSISYKSIFDFCNIAIILHILLKENGADCM